MAGDFLGSLLYNQPLASLPSCPIPFIQHSQTLSAKRHRQEYRHGHSSQCSPMLETAHVSKNKAIARQLVVKPWNSIQKANKLLIRVVIQNCYGM